MIYVILKMCPESEDIFGIASDGSQVVSMSGCYAGGLSIESSILPLLKHACGVETGCHDKLAIKRLAGVTPEVNIREHI